MLAGPKQGRFLPGASAVFPCALAGPRKGQRSLNRDKTSCQSSFLLPGRAYRKGSLLSLPEPAPMPDLVRRRRVRCSSFLLLFSPRHHFPPLVPSLEGVPPSFVLPLILPSVEFLLLPMVDFLSLLTGPVVVFFQSSDPPIRLIGVRLLHHNVGGDCLGHSSTRPSTPSCYLFLPRTCRLCCLFPLILRLCRVPCYLPSIRQCASWLAVPEGGNPLLRLPCLRLYCQHLLQLYRVHQCWCFSHQCVS